MTVTCPGGGRVNHDTDGKKLTIYGYSKGYGQANHEQTREMLEKVFPAFYTIDWNNEGY